MRPSIILSGVNHGQNMGTDLLYSGTVEQLEKEVFLAYNHSQYP